MHQQESRQNLADAADALLWSSRALVGVAARSLPDSDEVTLSQFRALVVLLRSTNLTVSNLADVLDVHPSTATRLCDRLVRKGLISRTSGTSLDRRETLLSLTVEGRGLVQKVTARRRRDIEAIVKRMSVTDRRYALLGLRSFAEAAGEMPGLDAFGWLDEVTTQGNQTTRKSS